VLLQHTLQGCRENRVTQHERPQYIWLSVPQRRGHASVRLDNMNPQSPTAFSHVSISRTSVLPFSPTSPMTNCLRYPTDYARMPNITYLSLHRPSPIARTDRCMLVFYFCCAERMRGYLRSYAHGDANSEM
jgi:hypothetical protein